MERMKEQPGRTSPAVECVEATSVDPRATARADIDFIAALRTRSCPICDYLEHVAFDFFCQFQFALSTQERTQQQFAEQHGFCPQHTWQLAAIMSPQSLSSSLPLLVERVSGDTGHLAASPRENPDRPAIWLVSAEQCQVCGLLREADRDFTTRLAEFVGKSIGQEAYARSQGLCLRHLDGLLAAVSTEVIRRFLLGEAARRFSELARDMRAYAAKHEALRQACATDDEKDAHRRALIHLVGDKGVCLP
jgi:hypothetical protein